MAKKCIIGSKNTQGSLKGLNESYRFFNIEDRHLSNDEAIHNFITEIFCEETTAIIIFADDCGSGLSLYIVSHVRFSVKELKNAVLLPILLVTNSDLSMFIRAEYSQMLLSLSKGLFICSTSDFVNGIYELRNMTVNDYANDFLNRTVIQPKTGNHNLANKWGAYILNDLIDSLDESQKKLEADLYFKYTFAKTITDYESYFNNEDENENEIRINKTCKSEGERKKILLIDDEAENGWREVLEKIIINADFTICSERVRDYEALPSEYKDDLDEYDLVLLDLRVNGDKEEKTLNTKDFSGYKILKGIKEHNSGIQIIMFTASTKIWNLQRLMEAGANGYYVKESPAYHFPREFSISNANSLIDQINNCFSHKSRLRHIVKKIDELKKHFQESEGCALFDNDSQYEDFKNDILNQMEVAYRLFSTANTKDEYSYSFCALEKVIELFTSSLERSSKIEDDNMLYIRMNYDKNIGYFTEDPLYNRKEDRKPPIFQRFSNIYYRFILNKDLSYKSKDISTKKELYRPYVWIDYRNYLMHPKDDNESKNDYYRKIKNDQYKNKDKKELVADINSLYDYLFKVLNSI